jgi:hypothetical protein
VVEDKRFTLSETSEERLQRELPNFKKQVEESIRRRGLETLKSAETSEYIILRDGVKRNIKTGMLEIIDKDK